MSVQTIAGAALVKALKKAWRKDRDHRYRINQPWSLPRLVDPVPDYAGRYVTIEDSVITVQPSDICDGATLAPDKVGHWVLIEAALAHDAIYAELDGIAAAWGWQRARVRRWADDVFYGIAILRAPHWLARLYWHGIRAGGGIAHAVGRLLALLAFAALCVLCGMLAGCGGCSTPTDPFGGQEQEEPVYEKVEKGQGK